MLNQSLMKIFGNISAYDIELLSHADKVVRTAIEEKVDRIALKAVLEIHFSCSTNALRLLADASGCTLHQSQLDEMARCAHAAVANGFSDDNVKRAARRFEGEVEYLLESNFWETAFYKLKGRTELPDEKRIILSLCERVKAKKLHNRSLEVGINFGESAFYRALALRLEDLRKIHDVLSKHANLITPHFLRARMLDKDKYGVQETSRQELEARDCFKHLLSAEKLSFFVNCVPTLEILDFVFEKSRDFSNVEDLPSSGIDFEYWCASQIETQGWMTKVTKASGDQGVDIEVWRGSLRVVVQCKRYTHPIGNKAVQEVFAGKQHSFADAAAIIGTGGFTRSAKELAKVTGVELFDVSEVRYFSDRILSPQVNS